MQPAGYRNLALNGKRVARILDLALWDEYTGKAAWLGESGSALSAGHWPRCTGAECLLRCNVDVIGVKNYGDWANIEVMGVYVGGLLVLRAADCGKIFQALEGK